MVRLTGEAAAQRLAAWYLKLKRSHILRQRIVHVLKPFTPDEFDKSPAYHAWCAGGTGAADRCVSQLMQDVGTVTFLREMTTLSSCGVATTRIFLASEEELACPGSVQRYVAEMLYPFFAGSIGEKVFRLSPRQYEAAGFPARAVDVNIIGTAGIIRTGYEDGQVAWREFLSWWRNPLQALAEFWFVLRVERFARRHGTPIEPAPIP